MREYIDFRKKAVCVCVCVCVRASMCMYTYVSKKNFFLIDMI